MTAPGVAAARTPARVAGILVALTLLLVAGGCVFPSGSGPDDASAGPRVGQCHDTPDPVLPDPHDPTPPVDCDQPHTLETFAVLHPLRRLDPQTATAAGERCAEELGEFLGADDFSHSALGVYYFTPTPGQRRQGERWVRCDVGVVTDTGFTGTRRVTGSLADALADGVPLQYRRCLRSTPDPVAPQPLVSCLQPHHAQQVPTALDLGDADSAYPGMDRLAERAQPECARSVRAQVPGAGQALVVVPTAAMWRSGTTTAQCWATAAPGERLNDSEAQPA